MIQYTFQATDHFGKTRLVEVRAESVSVAIQLLADQGFVADEGGMVQEIALGFLHDLKRWFDQLIAGKVSQRDLLRFVKMLGSSLSRGRSLKDSLEFIGENEDKRAVKHMIQQLLDRMKKPFSSQVDLFGIFPDLFDDEFLGIIEAGETSSNLGEYLIDYVADKKEQLGLFQLFRSVLIKRGLTLVMVLLVGLVVVLFVIPQFSQLFGDALEMPWALSFMLSVSDFFSHFGIVLLILIVLAVGVFTYFIQQNAQVRFWWHDLLLRLPILGKTLRTFYTAQFAYLLSTLLTKNVDLVRSMTIIIRQTRNVCIRFTCEQLLERMQKGTGLFQAILDEHEAGHDYFIPSIVQAAKVGGATASLGDTLLEVRHDLHDLFVVRLERSIKVFSIVFYAVILAFALFLAYAIGTAMMAFYENAQNLI